MSADTMSNKDFELLAKLQIKYGLVDIIDSLAAMCSGQAHPLMGQDKSLAYRLLEQEALLNKLSGALKVH